MVTDGVRQGHILVKKIGFIKPLTEREKHGVRADEERWRGGGKFFQISFFFFSLVFQRDLHHAATRLDHTTRLSEKQKAEIRWTDKRIRDKDAVIK